jgi:hypothetical protein
MNKMMIVYALDAVGHRPLESAQPPPPRTPLAGLVTIGRSVRSRTERSRRVPRPLQRSFALTLDLNRPSQPHLSDLPFCCVAVRHSNRQAGRTSGGDFGRLRSNLSSKLLSLRRGTRQPSPNPPTKGILEHNRASQPRSKRHAFPIYEPATSDGTKPAIDNNLLSGDPNILIATTR